MGVDEHGKPETVISTKSFPNELSAIDISEPLIEPEKIYSDEENCSTGMSIMSKAFLHFVLYSLTTYALVYGSYSHPYLLADNR